MKRLCTILVLIVLIASGSLAQEKNKEKKSSKKSAAPVNVSANLLVLDSKDQFVSDLKPEEVRILEDGVEQKITYLVRKDTILHLGLLVDNSGSLRSQFDRIQKAASTFAYNLDTEDEAFVIRFVSSDKIELLEDWTSDKKKLFSAIDVMYIEGGQSSVLDALALGIGKIVERQKAKPAEKYAMVLFSDCDEVDSYYSLDKILTSLKGTGIQIFPFALVGDIPSRGMLGTDRAAAKAINLANTLSLSTGGNSFFFEKKVTNEILQDKLRSIAFELRSQYVVGFTSTNQTRGTTRSLSVEIRNRPDVAKLKVYMRESYSVPED